jgi:hypothetical protein
MKAALIVIATVAVILLLVFLPNVLGMFLDPRNTKLIQARCDAAGVSDIKIKAWPNHYGVSFRKNGQRHYAKCRVASGVIKWKGRAPEDF